MSAPQAGRRRRPHVTPALLGAALLGAATACAAGAGGGGEGTPAGGDRVRSAPSPSRPPTLPPAAPGATATPSTAPAAGPTRLVVEASAGAGAAPVRATLTCDPPGGDHPDPATACGDLGRSREPFAPLPAEAACTELYGGPQTAVVRGTHHGKPVELELSRTDGCRTAQWDRLGALVHALVPVGG